MNQWEVASLHVSFIESPYSAKKNICRISYEWSENPTENPQNSNIKFQQNSKNSVSYFQLQSQRASGSNRYSLLRAFGEEEEVEGGKWLRLMLEHHRLQWRLQLLGWCHVPPRTKLPAFWPCLASLLVALLHLWGLTTGDFLVIFLLGILSNTWLNFVVDVIV